MELKVDWSWALAALMLFLPNYFVAALRFRTVLGTMRARPSVREAWTWTLDAALGDLVFPMVVGGDVVKLAHVSQARNRAVALAGTFADRLCGVFGVFVLAFAASLAAVEMLWTDSPMRPLMLTSLAVTSAMAISGILLFLLHRPIGLLFRMTCSRLPMGQKLIRVAESFSHWFRNPGSFVLSLSYATLGHLCWCLSALCLAKALAVSIDVRAAMLVLPMVILCNTISFAGGIGGGLLAFEYLFQHVLGAAPGDGTRVGLAMTLFVNLSKGFAVPQAILRLRRSSTGTAIRRHPAPVRDRNASAA